MVLHMYCMVSGGIPIFSRSSGSDTTPTFSEVAPLNGIQVFGKVHAVTFKSTQGKDFFVHWKNVTEKLSLILISKQSVLNDGEMILSSIFDAMVLTVGIDELTNVKRADRLKKEIRPCYPIVDEILKNADEYYDNDDAINLLPMVEVMPCSHFNLLQEKLDEWSESISSLFCCLTVRGKIVVATPAWWDLSGIEKKLLSIVTSINSNTTTNDIPVFLPIKSPKVAFRLVTCCLINDIWISALCGPAPSLMDFEQSVAVCWSPVVDQLNEVKTTVPKVLPDCFSLQNGIIGVMLVNPMVGKYLLLGSISENKIHLDILRIFYYQNVQELLKDNEKSSHIARETYWYSENYKLYAVLNENDVLCLLTSSVVPTPTVRLLAKDILNDVINDKIFLW
ncbi:protein fuzzy homolog isoform X2 [Planococcus citri]|uniref:protein fuzzy homolog isoform X2 n=1 Tax=Planococcus citri TaxID=170843 RepID=UPI0031F9F1D0